MWKWVLALCSVALLWSVLLWTGFQMKQSIVLALILTGIGFSVGRAAPRETVRFTPYFVRVRPKWHQILTDYRILESDDWEKLQESMNAAKLSEDHIFRAGVLFTVVNQSADGERLLVYRGPSLGFVSEIDWTLDLSPAMFQLGERNRPRLMKSSDVDFFIKQSGDGYGIGITVPHNWWENVKASCPTPAFEKRNHPCGTVDLAIAVLPYAEFGIYWDPIDYSDNFDKRVWAAVDSARKKYNWKLEEENDPLPELRIKWAKVIDHKYFEVDHNSI